MELDSKVVEQINSLRLKYEREEKLADFAFIKETLDIIESMPLFDSILNYEIGCDFRKKAECTNARIQINSKRVIDNTINEIKFWREQLLPDEIIPMRNMYVLALIFHEVTHVWQDCELSEFDEINRLYSDINNARYNNFAKLVYFFRGTSFSFERHANICAFKTLAEMYDEESSMGKIARMYYLDLLLYLYEKSYPVKKTLDIFRLKDNYNIDNIPVNVLIEHGFNVERNIIEYLDFLHEQYLNFDVNFEELKSGIRKL